MRRSKIEKDFTGVIYLNMIGVLLGALFLFGFADLAQAAFGDCPAGYEFQRMSGVGCVQKNCGSIPSAHYSYEGYCICGSAGSINENPADPNKRCTLPHGNAACPDCVYACVHNNEDCPGEKPTETVSPAEPPTEQSAVPAPAAEPGNQAPAPAANEQAAPMVQPNQAVPPAKNTPTGNEDKFNRQMDRINRILSEQLDAEDLNNSRVVTAGLSWEGVKNVVQRGFSASMQVLGWGLDKTVGWQLIEDKEDKKSGWAGMLVSPDGDHVDVKIFEGKLSFNWDEGVAAEFNLISIKGRPSSNSFIDGFSIGIGPGAVNKNEGDHEIPGTPISPNINFNNIRNYFGEKWDNVKSWWHENVPWPLGGANTPAVGGG